MDSVVDSAAVISVFSQVTGQSLYNFDTSFSDHGIRVDMAGLSPFSVALGISLALIFPLTLKLLVFLNQPQLGGSPEPPREIRLKKQLS